MNGLIFLGEQEEKKNVDNTNYAMTLNIFGNLSSPITLPVVASQTFNAIAKLYTNDDKNHISFSLNPLPMNPILETSAAPVPPFFTMTLGSVIPLMTAAFMRQDFVRMLKQRDKGIIEQYILFGVPLKSFYLTHMFLAVFTLSI